VTRCTYESCGGTVLEEPLDDPYGSGVSRICALCGRSEDTYTKLRSGILTADEFARQGKRRVAT
jgi:hypothetical protein